FFFQAEDGIRDPLVTGVQTCALPIFEAGRFRGEVDIAVGVERKRQEVVLHAAELKVERATAHADGVETTARVRADADAQTVTLRFPRPLPAGDARLRLRFSGRLNQHLRGLAAASAAGRACDSRP